MAILSGLIQKFIPLYLKEEEAETQRKAFRYKRLWIYTFTLTILVSLAPLITMAILNVQQYQKTLKNELIQTSTAFISNAKHSLEFNLTERQAALNYIIHDKSFEELIDQEKLEDIFFNLKRSFGGFVDLGLIDSKGIQRAYVGPYELLEKDYSGQDWFNAVRLRDLYISDVFMGFRGFPHFIIAVKQERNGQEFYVLRVTIDAEFINRQIQQLNVGSSGDVFILNHEGVLQTPSPSYGELLEQYKLPVPKFTPGIEVHEERDADDEVYMLGYAYIEQSPFIVMMVTRQEELMRSWITLRGDILGFLAVSSILITLVILWSTTYMVNRIKEGDLRRARTQHNLEYTNKMASIGRLAAGVAHEINNPLAIINEKAGLIKDIVALREDIPQQTKILSIVDSVLQSVERCKAITHRFLGFAKRMDLQTETINLPNLIREVLEFLGKEAIYRNISITISTSENMPEIESDRGLLQQILLNIINNAFAAVDDGGKVDIRIQEWTAKKVAIAITDNGHGIAEENLEHVFEPFFTTKHEGTGLGLSITYGIVQKLGGDMEVQSKLGKGTSFNIILPIKSEY